MDLRKLKTLIDLVQNSGISELEISEGEEKIRIAKNLGTPAQATYMVGAPHSAVRASSGSGSSSGSCTSRCRCTSRT